jgi:hypothetical protein
MTPNTRILLVEDNEGDIVLTLKAMEKVDLRNSIDVVRDGEKALEFLNKEGEYKNAETPGLILLDIIGNCKILWRSEDDPGDHANHFQRGSGYKAIVLPSCQLLYHKACRLW